MRIISGFLKGKSINFLKNINTRPLKDSVKENIFNILKHSNFIKVNIKDSNILDLYSGIGSFGIECLSRGAQKVTFIEKNAAAADILKKNLIKLSIIDKSKVYISTIENILNTNIIEKYNIFFLDPPFTDFKFLNNLKILKKNQFFCKNHIVIIHREKKAKDEIKDYLEIIKTKNYGRSKIIFGVFN